MPARDSHSATPAWQKTWLWETLQKRANERGNHHASEFLPTLELWMSGLDSVLQNRGNDPLGFILHDSGHALCVAHRMAELITPAMRRTLSDYELALLLLAAYGHDIGISPASRKLQILHRHLLDPAASTLTDAEQRRFQQFLDQWPDHPVTPPLSDSLADQCLADELTASYSRERHNDWSADWLRENLKSKGAKFGFLPDVVGVLIRLCSSHHAGFGTLARKDFDPLLTPGPQPQLIHLRYLARILRLADLLENDPGHLPVIIFRHRDPASRLVNLIRWQRGHDITLQIRDGRIHLQARPRLPHIHEAVLQLADTIDRELHSIAYLPGRLPVHNLVGGKSIKREWHLAPTLIREIHPTFTRSARSQPRE